MFCQYFNLPSHLRFVAQGPEIRTGFLENEQPVVLEAGHELTVTTDYSIKVRRMLCYCLVGRNWM